MYQILDYKKRAIDMLIPYLLEFPQIISIVEQNADRYQEIEKVLWELITNLRLDDSRGIWLANKTANTATSIIYTDMAKDAFTYGTDEPETQGYGAGHYYSQANYISGTNLSISEQKQIRGIKSKIIRNNFDGTIESFIKAMQLLFNADKVIISESYPLAISLMMKGDNLEISSSYMYEQIKHLLAGCVKLNNIFLDNNTYNVFQYDNKKAFGDSRYPALITDTLDTIVFKGKCIKFTSDNKMYCKVPVLMDTNKVFVTCGRLYKDIDTYSTIMSANDGSNSLSVYIDGDNKINLTINGVTQTYDTPLETNIDYTFVYYQSKLWVISGCKLAGSYDADISYINSLINYQPPSIQHSSQIEDINSNIYINSLVTDEGTIDDLSYGDFIYYNMVIGNKNGDTLILPNYYITSYGETKVLFNVANNYDHLKIYMSNSITSSFYEEQSVFKYEPSHTDRRNVLLENGDKIIYNTIGGTNTSLDLSLDLFLPFGEIDGEQEVLSIYKQDNTTELLKLYISLDENNNTNVVFKTLYPIVNEDAVQYEYTYLLLPIEYYKHNIININIKDNTITLAKDTVYNSYDYGQDVLQDIGNTVVIGGTYNGIISNVNVKTNLYNLILPFETTLNNAVYSHTNVGGAKFITIPSNIVNKNQIIID